jgi:alpha-tubulin suppressor-like RCC1 family protein
VKVADAVLLAAGFNHACVIRQSGKVSCWGYNYFGQLGNGVSQVNASAPVDVMNLTDAVTIAGGTVFTCAINKGGAATCWGANYSGQLGNGSKTDSNVPVPVFNLTDAVAITGGDSHACALRKSGTVVCWGNNSTGQLGNGTTADSLVPVPIPTLANAVAIQAGGLSTCALLQGGTISCWGSNNYGQLGNGSANNTPNPTPVTVAIISDAVSLGIGFQHACAVRAGGGIACWGEGGDGEIGNGITLADANTPTPTPAAVQNVSNAANVSGGAFHTCASTKDLHVFCWGSNSSGQLGNGGSGKRSFVPVAVSGF